MVAIVSYWGIWDRRTVLFMLPAAVVGIGIGWLTAAWVTEHQIRLIVGIISVLFALNYWFRDRLRSHAHEPNAAKGWFWGTIAGFTSFVSHAGGPPYQMYAAPLRMEPRLFAGTQVLLFAIINAVKLVPYFFLGQFDCAEPSDLGGPAADLGSRDGSSASGWSSASTRRLSTTSSTP